MASSQWFMDGHTWINKDLGGSSQWKEALVEHFEYAVTNVCVSAMPRCFLAKKSTSVNNGLHWGPEDVTNNNHHHDEQQQQESLAHRPSTIGSISAAKAVLSIQEPICPPPAHQASILASSASASAVVKAAAFLKEPNNNNRATHWPRASTEQQPLRPLIMTSSRPPRRKKPAQRQPLNLTLGEGKELGLKNGEWMFTYSNKLDNREKKAAVL